jgi:hypothetical protein
MQRPLLLALLLVAAVLTRAPSASATPEAAAGPSPSVDEAACPQWIREYASFHAANRGRSNAKYLSLLCNGTEVDGGGCHGAGGARHLARVRFI